MSTDPLNIPNCEPWVAEALARDIDAGVSDPNVYVGPSFADFQGREIARQINAGKGDLEALSALLIDHGTASAIVKAITDASERRA